MEWLGLFLRLHDRHGNFKRRTAITEGHIGPIGLPDDFVLRQPLNGVHHDGGMEDVTINLSTCHRTAGTTKRRRE